MDSSTKSNSCFFKTFRDPDREQRLRLPLSWTSKQGNRLPGIAYLRTGHGKDWAVTLAHDELAGRYSFEEGWRSFAEFNNLEYKDRFEFKYDGRSTFDFNLLHRNNEQEHIRVPCLGEEEEGQGEGLQEQHDPARAESEEVTRRRTGRKRGPSIKEADVDAVFEKAGIPRPDNPYFVTKLRTNRKEMYIPKELVRDFRLAFPKKIAIRDESGREFKAAVHTWKDGRQWLSRGWTKYCKKNKVHRADWCIMEVVRPESPAASMFLKARIVRAAAGR